MSYPFQVVYPFAMSVDANSFKDAIKQYAKLNYEMNINSMIITDQYKQAMKARLDYYKNGGGHKKIRISMQPTIWPMKAGLNGMLVPNTFPYANQVSYNTDSIEKPAPTFLDFGFRAPAPTASTTPPAPTASTTPPAPGTTSVPAPGTAPGTTPTVGGPRVLLPFPGFNLGFNSGFNPRIIPLVGTAGVMPGVYPFGISGVRAFY